MGKCTSVQFAIIHQSNGRLFIHFCGIYCDLFKAEICFLMFTYVLKQKLKRSKTLKRLVSPKIFVYFAFENLLLPLFNPIYYFLCQLLSVRFVCTFRKYVNKSTFKMKINNVCIWERWIRTYKYMCSPMNHHFSYDILWCNFYRVVHSC